MARKPKVPVGPMAARFNLLAFTDSLIDDLEKLRHGEISVKEAAARADLAKQVLRAVGLIVSAQKFMEGRVLPAPTQE